MDFTEMRHVFYILITILILTMISCKSSMDTSRHETNNLSDFNLKFLSQYDCVVDEQDTIKTKFYKDLGLKVEFLHNGYSKTLINDSLVFDSRSHQGCSLREIYNDKYLIISLSDCSAAGPDVFKREQIFIYDLQSKQMIEFSLDNILITRSRKVLEALYNDSPDYYSIENIDFESSELILYNIQAGNVIVQMDIN